MRGGHNFWRASIAPASVILLAALGRVLIFDPGSVNYDSAYGLSWGAEIAGGHAPSYDVTLAPTPHPLLNALGVLLSPFGADALGVTAAVFALAFGVVVWLGFQLGRELGGPAAGIAAAVLVATRHALVSAGALSFIDVPFTALVLGAIWCEVREPRRERGALVCLFAAGLLRPEAWVLALVYLVVLARRHGRLPSPSTIALAVGGPVVWVLADLATTGDALYSFTLTHDTAAELERTRGPGAIPIDLPRVSASVAGAAVVAGALAGTVLGLRRATRPTQRLLVLGLAATAATALVIAGGTSLLQRYLFVPATVACVLCGYALAELARSPRLRIAAGALALAIVVELVIVDRSKVTRLRTEAREQRHAVAELRDTATSARLGGCGPLFGPSRLAPWLSVSRGEPADRFIAPRPSSVAASAAVVATTRDPTARAIVKANPDRPPVATGPTLVEGRYWVARGDC